MAKAGDGARRSEMRRKSEVIRVRVAPEQRSRIEQNARRAGFATAAGFLRAAALQSDRAVSPGTAMMTGQLGYIGGWLTEAADGLRQAGFEKEAEKFSNYSKHIATMQRSMIEEEGNAGKGDPQPPQTRGF